MSATKRHRRTRAEFEALERDVMGIVGRLHIGRFIESQVAGAVSDALDGFGLRRAELLGDIAKAETQLARVRGILASLASPELERQLVIENASEAAGTLISAIESHGNKKLLRLAQALGSVLGV